MRSDIQAMPVITGTYDLRPAPTRKRFRFSRFGLMTSAFSKKGKIIPLGMLVELNMLDGWILVALARRRLSLVDTLLLPKNFPDLTPPENIGTYLHARLKDAADEDLARKNEIENCSYLTRVIRLNQSTPATPLDQREIQPHYLQNAHIDRATATVEVAQTRIDGLLNSLADDPFLRSPARPHYDLVPA